MTKKSLNQTEDNVLDIAQSSSLTMSHNAEVFHQLGLEQKQTYFREQYGKVTGTTWFFDYWFSKGIKDTKSFTPSEGIIVDACIAKDGWYYEGGGGDSRNGIIAIIGDDVFSVWRAEYYRSEGKDRKDNKSLDYKEIVDCTYNAESKAYAIKVKTENGGTKDITLEKGKPHSFDEGLIWRLYIPSGIKADANSTVAAWDLTDSLSAEKKDEEKPYTPEQMYDEAFTLYMEEGSHRRANSLLKENLIKDTSKHQENILKLFNINFPKSDSNYFNNPLESSFFLLSLIQDQTKKKEAAKRITEYLIGAPKCHDMESIEQLIKAVNIIWSDKEDYYQTYFFAHCNQFSIEPNSWSSDPKDTEKRYKNLEILAQDKIENHQALYEGYLKRGWLRDTCLGWSKDRAEKAWEIMKKFFADHGITEVDFFPEDYDISRRAESLKTIVELIKSETISQRKGQEIVTRNLAGFKAYLEKERKGFLEFYEVLYSNFDVSYDKDYFNEMSRLVGRMNGDSGEKRIIDPHANDKNYIRKLLESACEQEHLHTLDTLYKKNLIIYRKYIVAYAALCFKHGDTRQLEKVMTEAKITEKEKKQIIKPIYANGKIKDNDSDFNYIPYITYEMAIDTLKRYLDPAEKKFETYKDSYVPKAIIEHSEALLKRADITPAYVQQRLNDLHAAKNREGIYVLLQAGGLKIDKTIVSNRVRDSLRAWEFDIAEKLAERSWLIEVREKPINIERIKAGKVKYEHKIPEYIKKYQLGQEYHKYALDLKIKSGNLEEVLKYAKEHNVTLAPSQCQAYREVKAKQIADEKKREEESIEQERLEALKRVEIAKEFITLIEQWKWRPDIVLNYKKSQKFIFFRNDDGLHVASHPLEYHADIAGKVGAKKEQMLGGGWINMDNDAKTIRLYWNSGSYGAVPLEYRDVLVQVMSKSYPEYTVSIE